MYVKAQKQVILQRASDLSMRTPSALIIVHSAAFSYRSALQSPQTKLSAFRPSVLAAMTNLMKYLGGHQSALVFGEDKARIN